MSQPDYIFAFSDIGAEPRGVRFVNNRMMGQITEFHAALVDSELTFAFQTPISSILADCMDLALAVYVADRLSTSRLKARRSIHVVLPIRHPEILGAPTNVEQLRNLLYLYTEDEWTFEFLTRTTYGRLPERQPILLASPEKIVANETSLWSGGLDALAGLYSRMKSSEPNSGYALIGTGGSSVISSVQRCLAASCKICLPQIGKRPFMLVQIPIRVSGIKYLRKNAIPRARGFVFLLIGAACAAMQNQSSLYVYENGVGAINLPYRSSEIGLDHSKAVHPTMLLGMGRFVSNLIGTPFTYQNPFIFATKGQMCTDILQDQGLTLVHESVSCDRRHRSAPTQCGGCTSCLLRRQALAVHGVQEPANRYILTDNIAHGDLPGDSESLHLQAMLRQVAELKVSLHAPTPWQALETRYVELADVVDDLAEQINCSREEVKARLMQMYEMYASEWEAVRHVVGHGMLAG